MFREKLARKYSKLGDWAAQKNYGRMAVACFRREMEHWQKCGNNEKYLSCKLSLADTLGKFESHEKLQELLDGTENEYIRQFGKCSIEIVKVKFFLGFSQFMLGSYIQAERNVNEARKIAESENIIVNPLGSKIYYWLGRANLELHKNTEAEQCYRNSITIWQSLDPELDPSYDAVLATKFYLLGTALMLQYRFDEAMECYKTSATMHHKYSGKVEEHVVDSVIAMSEMLDCQGRQAEAIGVVDKYIELATSDVNPSQNAIAMLKQKKHDMVNGIGKIEVRVGGKKLNVQEAVNLLKNR